MEKQSRFRRLSRRDFIKLSGGALAYAAAMLYLPRVGRNVLQPMDVVQAANGDPDLYLGGTDTWISLPASPAIPPYHPDNLAPAPSFSTYMFGFRNVLGMNKAQKEGQKGHATHPAPLFWIDQYDGNDNPNEFRLQLTNLGLSMRPDLIDEHTVHFHGLRNIIPFFDGEPMSSLAVPIAGEFTYAYRVREPGTYMYHCHVEDVEHVHLGMTGLVFVRPKQNGAAIEYPLGSGKTYTKFAYNDGDGSTGYDREYAMLLTEVWAEAHWAFSHVQLPEWSNYRADFYMLNGRVYPDTIAPNGSIDFRNPVYDNQGALIPTPGYEHLVNQPLSSLVECNAGDRVLLRFSNLGFTKQNMTLSGIKMQVVGKDATHLRSGRDGTDLTYQSDGIFIGVGESYDVIFEAPNYRGTGPNPYDTYLLYNRNYRHLNNGDPFGYGGQMTEVHVYNGTLGAQTLPNT
jgi:FtsP/CotA-like multicopper oxidase with cupredoxin domain